MATVQTVGVTSAGLGTAVLGSDFARGEIARGGSVSDLVASLPVAAGGLPQTGASNIAVMVVLGLLLILGGLMAWGLAKKYRGVQPAASPFTG